MQGGHERHRLQTQTCQLLPLRDTGAYDSGTPKTQWPTQSANVQAAPTAPDAPPHPSQGFSSSSSPLRPLSSAIRHVPQSPTRCAAKAVRAPLAAKVPLGAPRCRRSHPPSARRRHCGGRQGHPRPACRGRERRGGRRSFREGGAGRKLHQRRALSCRSGSSAEYGKSVGAVRASGREDRAGRSIDSQPGTDCVVGFVRDLSKRCLTKSAFVTTPWTWETTKPLSH